MASQYTSQPRTRVVTRAALNNGVHENMSIGQTQAIQPKKKLFDDLSIAQIIAGAAAAATSVALVSKIGIAGSVIGAAISSVITVVSSQVYRHFLTNGARKINQAAGAQTPNYTIDDPADVTARLPRTDAAGAHAAPTNASTRKSKQRSATQKRVVLFSVIVAAVAVIACVVVILLGTSGQGLGDKPQGLAQVTEDASDTEAAPKPSSESAKTTPSTSQKSTSASTDTGKNAGTSSSTSTGAATSTNSGTSAASGNASGDTASATADSTASSASSTETSDAATSDSSSDTARDTSSSNGQQSTTQNDQSASSASTTE